MEVKPKDLRNIILNSKFPQLFRGLKIPWNVFEMTLEEFCFLLDENFQEYLFEEGNQKYYDEPQWERTRLSKLISATKFLEESTDKNWLYYSYKNIGSCPEKCKDSIDFSFLGFPEIKEHILFWLGNFGSHTPCHFDTYGLNIVVQVYGRKSWILFPPDTKLDLIRVPYEESSVYCEQNLFSPFNMQKFKDVKKNAYHLIMEPGDVLIIPNKWFHYVENLETSLSFNTWIQLETDIESQIEECIVLILIKQFSQYLDESSKKIILNPNELKNFNTSDDMFTTLNYLISQQEIKDHPKKLKTNKYSSLFLSNQEYTELLQKYSGYLTQVLPITECEFLNLMSLNSNRYDISIKKENISEKCQYLSHFINSVCNPQTISLVKSKYINELNKIES